MIEVSGEHPTTDYDAGFSEGYTAYRRGAESRFFVCERRSDGSTRYGERAPNGWRLARDDAADYAHGYIDGFARAESDSHE